MKKNFIMIFLFITIIISITTVSCTSQVTVKEAKVDVFEDTTSASIIREDENEEGDTKKYHPTTLQYKVVLVENFGRKFSGNLEVFIEFHDEWLEEWINSNVTSHARGYDGRTNSVRVAYELGYEGDSRLPSLPEEKIMEKIIDKAKEATLVVKKGGRTRLNFDFRE